MYTANTSDRKILIFYRDAVARVANLATLLTLSNLFIATAELGSVKFKPVLKMVLDQ